MDQATFQKIVDEAMATVPQSARFEYDEALVFFLNLRAQLVAVGATDANIVPWLHDCLAPPFIEASDSAQIAGAMRALRHAFGYEMTVEDDHKTSAHRQQKAP